MAKMIDLNALEQPVLEIKLRDADRTVFRLVTPTTKLVERFIGAKAEIGEVAKTGDVERIKRVYDIAAELISCNADYITVTADELRDKYRLSFGDVVTVFTAYLEFIKEISEAKN